MKTFSIVIPTYEMHGKGMQFLHNSLRHLCNQTFKDFEIIVTDHSEDHVIQELCSDWSALDIKYFRNTKDVGNFSSNTNMGIDIAQGKWIKLLFQDDFLASDTALETLAANLDNDVHWAVAGCYHTDDGKALDRPFEPSWGDRLHEGVNTLSSPTNLVFRNTEDNQKFDTNYCWMMDIDWYIRAFQKYGLPKLIPDKVTVVRTWEGQLSSTLTNPEKQREHKEIYDKFKGQY